MPGSPERQTYLRRARLQRSRARNNAKNAQKSVIFCSFAVAATGLGAAPANSPAGQAAKNAAEPGVLMREPRANRIRGFEIDRT